MKHPLIRHIVFLALIAICTTINAQQTDGTASREARPGTRWWWLGSAVDERNLRRSLEEYARAGIGTVEITPLYGVMDNERREIPFLSPQWMEMLRTVETIAAENDIQVDMNCGTGWPFGGPEVSPDEAACKAVFTDSGVVIGRTNQTVKRAAPGGEGLVIDHFDRQAVRRYLDKFDRAFKESGTPFPATVFNDSYEVYGANWTPTLLEEFARRRGYRLEDHLPELLGEKDDGNETLADYRETLSDLLYENFTLQWVEWAHSHGMKTRNQAHGSPANLLDLYAAVDIPEIEGFGLSDFGICGLRTDPGMTRKNYSDVSMLKYASSAAHVTGKPLTSSETLTWLTEHFRTSLSQMKPDIDLMFTCGINRIFFHGTCYSPADAPWPGWKFYATVDMSPTNSIWRDAPFMMRYIERCQSILQRGDPDNDFLVYLPIRDMWHKRLKEGEKGLLMQFDIHKMGEIAPEFIHSILTIDSLGYDCDYISDRQLRNVRIDSSTGTLVTEGGTHYKALIIPTGTTMTDALQSLIAPLSGYVIMGEDETAMSRYARAEEIRRDGLRAIRRRDGGSCYYFISNLTPDDVDKYYELTGIITGTGKEFTNAMMIDPMTGDTCSVDMRDGKVRLCLRSGESCFLMDGRSRYPNKPTIDKRTIDLTHNKWTLHFVEEIPQVKKTFTLDSLQTWERLDDDSVRVTMGTGVYTTTVRLNTEEAAHRWCIDLGDVRESARVYINDRFIGCAWAVPFVLDCHDAIHKGLNTIRIEVTNLPANRIADMDRRGVVWRRMKDINIVDINYKKSDYSSWLPMPSGLIRVKLQELTGTD